MTKYNLFTDVSSYQRDDLEFFKKLKRHGVKAAVIKLTQGSEDGDAYVNPKFRKQLGNARKAGLWVHAYHFARFTSVLDAVNEARWFVKNLDKFGVSMKSAAVIDVEDPLIPKFCLNKGIQKFLAYVELHGYKKTDIYSMASWHWNHAVSDLFFHRHNMWIARYGPVPEPGVKNAGSWQYTDNFAGLHVDMSYDFKNFYTA